MVAYKCNICENDFSSSEITAFCCYRCERIFCEDCFQNIIHEDQDGSEDVCGECWDSYLEDVKTNKRDEELEEARREDAEGVPDDSGPGGYESRLLWSRLRGTDIC